MIVGVLYEDRAAGRWKVAYRQHGHTVYIERYSREGAISAFYRAIPNGVLMEGKG